MIEIGFNCQAQLVDRITSDLVGRHPVCWDLVLPPGFGEERLADLIARRLRLSETQPRVAVQGADHSNANIGSFIHAIHRQWTDNPSSKKLSKTADLYLDLLLAEIGKGNRPVILILKRFHKVLDALDLWVLGKLRTEEQAGRLHTVIMTPLPLASLKKRWESKHYFSNSDYGNSRHITETVEPSGPSEIAESCSNLNIPDGVIDFAQKVTGGYPEILAAVLEWWEKQGRPHLLPTVQAQMLRLARDRLSTFIEWLDPLEDGQFRDHVINLYHGVEIDMAREAFHNHPWRAIVLDDDGLRSEAVGAAAMMAALHDDESRRTKQSLWYEATDRARRLYERQQYETTISVLDGLDPNRLRPHDRLIRAHAGIMCALTGNDGKDDFGEDTDCRLLCKTLVGAHKILEETSVLAANERLKLEGRYHQLEEVAAAVAATSAVTGPLQSRVVDILAGFADEKYRHDRAAALLLFAKCEGGKKIAGDASACQFALPLPEQLYRIWGLWKVGVNYYAAPGTDDVAWDLVEAEWPVVYGKVQRASVGGQFSSFFIFAYFAMARWQALPQGNRSTAPEATFKDLQIGLAAYERVRTGRSHGIHRTSRRERDNYFKLIDRWLASVLAEGPGLITREEISEMIEPLPAVDSSGRVYW